MMDVLLTADEVATKLRATRSWVMRAAQERVIASRKVGRARLFTEADVDEYLERVHEQPTDPWARSARSQSRRSG
jgi:excisionase family DNA binding protein